MQFVIVVKAENSDRLVDSLGELRTYMAAFPSMFKHMQIDDTVEVFEGVEVSRAE